MSNHAACHRITYTRLSTKTVMCEAWTSAFSWATQRLAHLFTVRGQYTCTYCGQPRAAKLQETRDLYGTKRLIAVCACIITIITTITTGLKAFFTTPQLSTTDKVANSLALGTSPIVRALIDPEGGMRDVRALDSISFADWFKSHGGSQASIDRMWDPIGAIPWAVKMMWLCCGFGCAVL